MLLATMIFQLVSGPAWTSVEKICFFQNAQERLYIDKYALAFEIQNSGKVMISARIWRVETLEGKPAAEHMGMVRFTFSLPALPRIVGNAPIQEELFFPAFSADVAVYRELIRVCVEEQLFPSNVVKRSEFLKICQER